jgi:mannose-1-phosphate guanylyltransferase
MITYSALIHPDANGPYPAVAASPERVALLLAGGDGTRLQELTRQITGKPLPKQYCRLWHGSSLLEATISRARLFASRERISVVVNKNHLGFAEEQLAALPKANILVQPLNRDTGPGLLFALLQLEKTHPDAVVALFPTDHFIDDDRAFTAHIVRAAHMISQFPEKIAILGITPERPESGFGYILPAAPLENCEGVFQVGAFTEKPSLDRARNIISCGGLWNTFVMVFKLSRMMELMMELMPEAFAAMSCLSKSLENADEVYRNVGAWNLSTQLLARIPQHLIVVEVADVHWSDWGTRESIERTYQALNMVPFWNPLSSVSTMRSANRKKRSLQNETRSPKISLGAYPNSRTGS